MLPYREKSIGSSFVNSGWKKLKIYQRKKGIAPFLVLRYPLSYIIGLLYKMKCFLEDTFFIQSVFLKQF